MGLRPHSAAPVWVGLCRFPIARCDPRHGSLNRYAMPKSDVTLDVCRRGLDVRVVPGRVLVDLAVHNHVVVARCPLPATHAVRFAWTQMLALHGFGGKVLVAFDRLAGVALGDHLAVPDRSCHLGSLDARVPILVRAVRERIGPRPLASGAPGLHRHAAVSRLYVTAPDTPSRRGYADRPCCDAEPLCDGIGLDQSD